MTRIRPERVAHLIQRELADILERRMRDPRLSQWVSITDVEVTPDLSFARVFVAPSAARGGDGAEVLDALNRAAGFVRRELAPRLGLREVPELRFLPDDSIERGARVDELLRKLRDGEPVADDEEGA